MHIFTMLNVVMLSAIKLRVIMLNIIMLNVIMFCAVMLSVVAFLSTLDRKEYFYNFAPLQQSGRTADS
jgi:hypothetical protein